MPRRQHGYALLIILLLFSLLALTLAEAAPGWITAIQRQREQTAIDYARQYVMGIRRYYHKFGAYPPNLDRLEATDDVHYLRRAWPDPLVKNGKWYFIHPGDLIAPKVKGVPGEGNATGGPGAAFAPAGGGPTGGLLASPAAASGMALAGTSDGNSPESAGGLTGAATSHALAFSLPHIQGGSIDGIEVVTGYRLRKQNSGFAGAGSSVGGGPIIGIAIPNHKPAVHEFDGKNRPDEWLFIYDPAADRSLGGGMPERPASPTPNPPAPSSSPTGGMSGSGGGPIAGPSLGRN